jgi:hypothetical protein
LRAIKSQHRCHKLSKSGNSPEITIDDNHTLAPTAHVITTGAPKERFIFTSDAPPPSLDARPIDPQTKLKDIPSISVQQEEVGVMFDNGSLRTSKNQGLIRRAGNVVFLKCSGAEIPKYAWVD